MEVGEVFSEVKSLATVKSNLLAARLEHVVTADMALQDKLRVAPASRHMQMYYRRARDGLSFTVTGTTLITRLSKQSTSWHWASHCGWWAAWAGKRMLWAFWAYLKAGMVFGTSWISALAFCCSSASSRADSM